MQFQTTFSDSMLESDIQSKMLDGVSKLTSSLELSTDRERLIEEKRKQERIQELEHELEPLKLQRGLKLCTSILHKNSLSALNVEIIHDLLLFFTDV